MTYDPIDTNEADSTADGSVTAQDLVINGLLNGADISTSVAGEALTSDGAGGFGFSPTGSAAITRNGNEIEYVALNTANLPTATDTGDVALVTSTNQYVQDSAFGQAFDIGSASLEKSINSQDSTPEGIAFNTDGTRLYEVGNGTNKIFQSSLSTPFDIASATFSKSINSQDQASSGIAFNTDGTLLYEVGASGNKIYQSKLSGIQWQTI